MTSILFVCAGNLCRSPIAEAIARTKATSMGLSDQLNFASAGTQPPWPGSKADPRAIAIGARRGYDLRDHKARRVGADDFLRFDHILAMDRHNLDDLVLLQPEDLSRPVLQLFAPFSGISDVLDVPDPYFGNPQGFERVFDLCEAGITRILERQFG